jgi:O-antigen ligase
MPTVTYGAAIPTKLPISVRRQGLTLGMGFLLLLILVAVGRIHEALPALANVRIGLIAGLGALVFWMIEPSSLMAKVPLNIKQVRYLFMLLGLGVITIPISVWPGHSFEFVTGNYLKLLLLFLLVLYWCDSVANIRKILWVCCLGLIVLVSIGLLTISELRFSAESRTYDPNDLAMLLIMMIPLLLYLFAVSGIFLRLVLSGMILLSLYAIVLTQSRAGLLGIVVVGTLVMWRSTISKSNKLLVAGIAFLVFSVFAGAVYWERMETIWAPKTELDRMGGGRTEVWKTGLKLMATHPWGVGIDGFSVAYGLSHGGGGEWKSPHNSFLQVGVELGVVGLIIFVLCLARTIRDLQRIQAHARRSTPTSAVPSAVRMSAGMQHTVETMTPTRDNAMLAGALEISLWGFIVGGFFLTAAYSALLYIIVALSLASYRLAGQFETLERPVTARADPPPMLGRTVIRKSSQRP